MKCIAISDTHQVHTGWDLPSGDILIHCGDFSNHGLESEFRAFLHWFSRFPHLHKIVVPGNHDRYVNDFPNAAMRRCENLGIRLLIDETVNINGVTFFGFPWTQTYGRTRGFMLSPGKLKLHTHQTYRSADVLISHGPPAGIFDKVGPLPVGSPDLLKRIECTAGGVRPPLVHVFGHVHPEHGGRKLVTRPNGCDTVFANVVSVDNYKAVLNSNPCFVFDIAEINGAVNFSVDGLPGVGYYSSIGGKRQQTEVSE